MSVNESVRDFCERKLAEIDADDRHHAKPALVQVNAPLALIQVGLGSEEAAYKSVLEVLDGDDRP